MTDCQASERALEILRAGSGPTPKEVLSSELSLPTVKYN